MPLAPCIVLGDSIAVGVASALPRCAHVAKVGISSGAFLSRLAPSTISQDQVVISLGANDGYSMETRYNLYALRRRIEPHADVVWLMPARPSTARDAILEVARMFGDRVVDTAPYAGRDGLHPGGDGYRRIASGVWA